MLENLHRAAAPPASTSTQSNPLSRSSRGAKRQARALKILHDLKLKPETAKAPSLPYKDRIETTHQELFKCQNDRMLDSVTKRNGSFKGKITLTATYLEKHITDSLREKLLFIAAYI